MFQTQWRSTKNDVERELLYNAALLGSRSVKPLQNIAVAICREMIIGSYPVSSLRQLPKVCVCVLTPSVNQTTEPRDPSQFHRPLEGVITEQNWASASSDRPGKPLNPITNPCRRAGTVPHFSEGPYHRCTSWPMRYITVREASGAVPHGPKMDITTQEADRVVRRDPGKYVTARSWRQHTSSTRDV